MRATAVEPMVPPAPPRLSMMTATPSVAESLSAMARANTSLDPPGGNGTTKVMLRLGQACANAAPGHADARRSAPPRPRRCRRFMSGLLAHVTARGVVAASCAAAGDRDFRLDQSIDLLAGIADFAQDFDAVAAQQRRWPDIVAAAVREPVGKGEVDDLAFDRMLHGAEETDVGEMLVVDEAF